jgi:hypothetical protein
MTGTQKCLTMDGTHGESGETLCWHTSNPARCLCRATPSLVKVEIVSNSKPVLLDEVICSLVTFFCHKKCRICDLFLYTEFS